MKSVLFLYLVFLPGVSMGRYMVCNSYWFQQKITLSSNTLPEGKLLNSRYGASIVNENWITPLYVLVDGNEKFKVIRSQAYQYEPESKDWTRMTHDGLDEETKQLTEVQIEADTLSFFGVSKKILDEIETVTSHCRRNRPKKTITPESIEFALSARLGEKDHQIKGIVSFSLNEYYDSSIPNRACPKTCQ